MSELRFPIVEQGGGRPHVGGERLRGVLPRPHGDGGRHWGQ
jgi:hypothetical protein